MSRPSNILVRAINYDHTLVLAVELSNKSWVLAAQVPGLPRTKALRTIESNKNALLAAIDGYRARWQIGRTTELTSADENGRTLQGPAL